MLSNKVKNSQGPWKMTKQTVEGKTKKYVNTKIGSTGNGAHIM